MPVSLNSVRMSTSSTVGSGRSMTRVSISTRCVAAAFGVGPALQRRRGGAEDDDSVVELGAHDRDVAAMVARSFLLLVAGVVLLVDEDEAEVDHGREDGGARADDNAGFAAADAVPLLGALVGRQAGVQQGDLRAEGGEHLAGHGRGEADLRHQQQRGLAGVERALHGGEVDAGFAGAGDAVEEDGPEATLRHRGGDGRRAPPSGLR